MEDFQVAILGDEFDAEGADNGSAKSFSDPSYDTVIENEVTFVVAVTALRCALEERLRQSKTLQLLDFQMESIVNIVYRPHAIQIRRSVIRTNRRGTSKRIDLREDIRHGRSDIGTTVVNDLMPGSGKTVVTMVASLYFAMHRAHDVINREEILLREQRPMNWSSRVGSDDSPREYWNAVIVLASDKVVAQWERATIQACAILNVKFDIHRDPKREVMAWNSENVIVCIFTSVMTLKRCFPKDDGFVPCVVVDEFVVKAPHNIVTRNADETPLYGRLLLVSADAGDTAGILLGSRKTSLIRTTVEKRILESPGLKSDVKLSAALMACSVLSTKSRREAHDFIIKGLNKVVVEKYTINFSSPVWGTLNGDLVYAFPEELESLGIRDLLSVRTAPELKDKICEALDVHNQSESTSRVLNLLSHSLDKFLSSDDDCAVCLDPIKSKPHVCLVFPCAHFFCKKCVKRCLKARDSCPSCRAVIDGVLDFRPGSPLSQSAKHVDVSECKVFDDFVRAFLPEEPSAIESCSAIIRASAAALVEEVPTPVQRILIIGPSTEFGGQLRKSLRGCYSDLISIIQLKVQGNKRKRTSMGYEEQLEWFKGKSDGDQVKVLCTHENVNFTDDILGLDLHEVDTICHVGGGINSRRLGRVTRLQRVVGRHGSRVRLFNLLPR